MPNHFHLLVWIKEEMYYKYSKEDFKNSTLPNADRTASTDAVRFGSVRFEDVKWETIDLSARNNPSASKGPDGIELKNRKKANPTKHFSHLCNAYAKYVNEKYDRHGSLFQRPFRRKPVESDDYLQRVVVYIHNNPVHHGFTQRPSDYPWSSYHTFLSSRSTKLLREAVLDWFGGLDNFKEAHCDHFDQTITGAGLEDEEN